ncbi:MAG: aspartate carbamoyltransferase regulatory subunit [Treponema sp.]|jgi:aspartate carbamoyltransferase regulatory subunit|nr:aspartate carbamoyltransferase regulatory subunit [Treponema sp.]
MLNIAQIKNGIVIDHIRSGQGIRIFNWLGLGRASYNVAFVVNANSNRMDRKDIIKIDNTIEINFDILGLIGPDITVNVIEKGLIIKKIKLSLPGRVENILICKNPRCITSTEACAPHIFHLEDPQAGIYRCEYCDETRSAADFR